MPATPTAMIVGTGHAVPDRILTNADFERMVETSDQWIVERTGIRERHVVEPGTPLSALAIPAAQRALTDAGIGGDEIDLVIVGTVTGDLKFPSTACIVQQAIGARQATAFDVSAACSGFLYSMRVATAMIGTGEYRKALVIGGDILTSMVNWQDRDTCVLFGDAAAAAVLVPSDGRRGLLGACLRSDGAYVPLLCNQGGGSLHPYAADSYDAKRFSIHMDGREVFRHAVVSMADALQQALDRAGVTLAEIDVVIPHQANLRIIEALGKRFGIPAEKVFVNVDRYGNTSAGSIPLALDEARRSGRIQQGTTVALVTFGAGFTWAGAVMRF